MEREIEHSSRMDDGVPLVGRSVELRFLTNSLRRRKPVLLLGALGSGKSRLLEEAMRLADPHAALIRRPAVLHSLLVSLGEALGCGAKSSSSLAYETSVALKAKVLDALRRSPRCLILEDVATADPRMYRFLQQAYYVPQVSLVVTALSRGHLGHLHKLMWDPRAEIRLEPLNRQDSARLFDYAAEHYRLSALEVAPFRQKVLAAAQGNPGQILAMCRLAARPEYQEGRYIKFLPLRIDVLTSFAL